MKKLIVCCDGTWNTPDQEDDNALAPTNVYKLYNSVVQDITQLAYYQAGVGTEGLIDKLIGGALGVGISEDICECYKWIATHYEKGDEICLFGFSRGAFAARSLAGFIGKCGLLDFNNNQLPDGISRAELVERAYKMGYRDNKSVDEWSHGHSFHETNYNGKIAVDFIGVWDTVGALGVPDDKVILNLFDKPSRYRFHDVTLGDHINKACHAVAIDEMRGSFAPTLWKQDDRVTQVWFPGVHSDVGGGYKETGLSDGALEWMINKASDAGIEFITQVVDQIKPNAQDFLHDSHTGLMKVLITSPRNIPDMDNDTNKDVFYKSVTERRQHPPINQPNYRPTHNIEVGNKIIDIAARKQWNWTGIYLQKGQEYEFTAKGEWQDKSIPCGPAGTNDGRFHAGEVVHIIGSAMGKLESAFKWLTKKEQSDFIMSKRQENFDWFSLVGAISDSGNPFVDGTHEGVSYFNIGEGTKFVAETNGYLYCFANDAWGFYSNNRGFVTLDVKKCN